MDACHAESDFSPQLVWGYNRRGKTAQLAACQPEYEVLDYRLLIHPDDFGSLTTLIKRNIRKQKRQFQSLRQIVSLHRVKDSHGRYHPHLSLITITRDRLNRLAFLYGIDYHVPTGTSLTSAKVQRFLQKLLIRQDETKDEAPDPFAQTWRCGNHFVSPSLFRMVDFRNGSTIELSEKQSRFIALLLGARDAANTPIYVERAITRRHVFGTDPESRINDNDIDQLVKFFRRHLGTGSIGTKRGYGHILGASHDVCEGEEFERALSFFWTPGQRDELSEAN